MLANTRTAFKSVELPVPSQIKQLHDSFEAFSSRYSRFNLFFPQDLQPPGTQKRKTQAVLEFAGYVFSYGLLVLVFLT